MSDEELDRAITERFKAYEKGISLPDGFSGRFLGSVRQKRALRRIRTLGLICAATAVCATVAGITKPAAAGGGERPVLTARTSGADKTTGVSCWMLLGYLRECFSRARSSRRKEEEQAEAQDNHKKGYNINDN